MEPRLLLEERRRMREARLRHWIERERLVALWMHAACASPSVEAALATVSRLGDGVFWYVLIATLPWWGGPQGTTCAIYMVALGAVNLVFYKALKHRVGRERPYVSCPGIRRCARTLDEFSFPSGHIMHAVAFSLVLAHYHPALAAPLWVFTVLVATSRVVLGMHYPTDVLAGAAIGWVTAMFMLEIV